MPSLAAPDWRTPIQLMNAVPAGDCIVTVTTLAPDPASVTCSVAVVTAAFALTSTVVGQKLRLTT